MNLNPYLIAKASPAMVKLIRAATKIPWAMKAVWLDDWASDLKPTDGCWRSPENTAERNGLEPSTVERTRQILVRAQLAIWVPRPGKERDGIRPVILLEDLVPREGATLEQLRAAQVRFDSYLVSTGLFRRKARGQAALLRRAEQLLAPPAPPPVPKSEQLLGIQEEIPGLVDRQNPEQLLAEAASNCSPASSLDEEREKQEREGKGEALPSSLEDPSRFAPSSGETADIAVANDAMGEPQLGPGWDDAPPELRAKVLRRIRGLS